MVDGQSRCGFRIWWYLSGEIVILLAVMIITVLPSNSDTWIELSVLLGAIALSFIGMLIARKMQPDNPKPPWKFVLFHWILFCLVYVIVLVLQRG